jgi:hypothetical protein
VLTGQQKRRSDGRRFTVEGGSASSCGVFRSDGLVDPALQMAKVFDEKITRKAGVPALHSFKNRAMIFQF